MYSALKRSNQLVCGVKLGPAAVSGKNELNLRVRECYFLPFNTDQPFYPFCMHISSKGGDAPLAGRFNPIAYVAVCEVSLLLLPYASFLC